MKLNRLEIWKKYNGLCAYTGKPLGSDWQIDHITSKFNAWYNKTSENIDKEENLLPSLRIVNHYKRSLDLEGFRKYMLTFHLRLAKLPKVTHSSQTQKRKDYMYKVADAFDIKIERPFDGVFYFEKIK